MWQNWHKFSYQNFQTLVLLNFHCLQFSKIYATEMNMLVFFGINYIYKYLFAYTFLYQLFVFLNSFFLYIYCFMLFSLFIVLTKSLFAFCTIIYKVSICNKILQLISPNFVTKLQDN